MKRFEFLRGVLDGFQLLVQRFTAVVSQPNNTDDGCCDVEGFNRHASNGYGCFGKVMSSISSNITFPEAGLV